MLLINFQVNIIEKPKPVLGIDETDEIKKAKDVIKKAPKIGAFFISTIVIIHHQNLQKRYRL